MLSWLPNEPAVQPFDHYNQELLTQVHLADWENPEPAPRYDLVVIGAGTAGLVVAVTALAVRPRPVARAVGRLQNEAR
jgi:hypothetical protein